MDRSTRNSLLIATGAATGVALASWALARRSDRYSFAAKTVLITGGSRGLGLVLAREFAAEGARLVLCARDPAELERARTELAADGAEVLTVPCDVTEPAEVDRLFATARERFGTVDVLVNNAGMIEVGPLEVQTIADFEAAMRIHFWAPLYTTLAALPDMRQRGEGRIVNVSSIGGKVAVPHCASKFALVGFSEGLRGELAKDGIRVTTVCPGLMRTGGAVNARFKGRHREEYTWFALSDSLPGITVSAETAARQIVAACRRGDPELIVSLLAEVAVRFHGVFPGLTSDLMGIANRLLPGPGGIGTDSLPGKASETPITRSPLTGLTQEAAAANDQ